MGERLHLEHGGECGRHGDRGLAVHVEGGRLRTLPERLDASGAVADERGVEVIDELVDVVLGVHALRQTVPVEVDREAFQSADGAWLETGDRHAGAARCADRLDERADSLEHLGAVTFDVSADAARERLALGTAHRAAGRDAAAGEADLEPVGERVLVAIAALRAGESRVEQHLEACRHRSAFVHLVPRPPVIVSRMGE